MFGGPAWAWDARRGQYYLHNFLTEQPDLNVHNRAVQDALLDTARFWLERGVDGFRMDAIDYAMHDPVLTDNPPAAGGAKQRTRPIDFQQPRHNKSHPDIVRFIERVRALTDSYGDRFTVAEVGGEDSEPAMKQFTTGRRFDTAYGFNFLYADALSSHLVRSALEAWPANGGGWPSWAFSNHDAPRAVSRWATPSEREACARVAMLLLVSLRGNIFVYQGEELGLPQARLEYADLKDPEAIANWPRTLGRDGARTPMPWRGEAVNAGFSTGYPWLPVAAAHVPLAMDRQDRDPDSQLALTRRLIALRKATAALRLGDVRFMATGSALLAFERATPADQVLCAFNFGSATQALQPEPPGTWQPLYAVGGADCWTLPPWSGILARRLP